MSIDCALMGILRILGPIKFCKGPMKIFKFACIGMGYVQLAHFKGPSSFWASIISDFDMQSNLPNCSLWSIFVQLNINQ